MEKEINPYKGYKDGTTAFHVASREEAWQKANEIFPTDYKKDETASERAGYPIYRSTATDAGIKDWISDLGARLELNLKNGAKTLNIWITPPTPKITAVRRWSMEDIVEMCIENNFYTQGDALAYSRMLQRVEVNEPTPEEIYIVAVDILDHTDPNEDQTITNIMCIIENTVVRTIYENGILTGKARDHDAGTHAGRNLSDVRREARSADAAQPGQPDVSVQVLRPARALPFVGGCDGTL